MEKKNLAKLYETFLEEVEPTEEMELIYNKISDKILKIKNILNEQQADEIDQLEELFSKVNYLETKEAFHKGFSVAINIILESKEK